MRASAQGARARRGRGIGTQRRGRDDAADARMVRRLSLHGDSRFKPWHRTDSDNRPTPCMAGWRKEIRGDTVNLAGELPKRSSRTSGTRCPTCSAPTCDEGFTALACCVCWTSAGTWRARASTWGAGHRHPEPTSARCIGCDRRSLVTWTSESGAGAPAWRAVGRMFFALAHGRATSSLSAAADRAADPLAHISF